MADPIGQGTDTVVSDAFVAARELLLGAEEEAARLRADVDRYVRQREQEAELLVGKARRLLAMAEERAASIEAGDLPRLTPVDSMTTSDLARPTTSAGAPGPAASEVGSAGRAGPAASAGGAAGTGGPGSGESAGGAAGASVSEVGAFGADVARAGDGERSSSDGWLDLDAPDALPRSEPTGLDRVLASAIAKALDRSFPRLR